MIDARAVVINAALSYGVNVLLIPPDQAPPSGFSVGPMGGVGLSFRRNALVIEPDAEPEDILHELSHLVVGKPSMNLSEGFVLMPFEWQLAKHIARRMPTRQRNRFMNGVREYQGNTTIGMFQMAVDDFGPGVRRTRWWRHGVDRARRLKLLYVDNTPTFLRAQWKDSGVPAVARRWDPGYDERFA